MQRLLQITCIYKLRHNWSYINPVSANGGVFRFSGGSGRLCGRNRRRFCVIGLFCKLNLVRPARGIVSRVTDASCRSRRRASLDWLVRSCLAIACLVFFIHGLAELPRQYPVDGDRLDFFPEFPLLRESYRTFKNRNTVSEAQRSLERRLTGKQKESKRNKTKVGGIVLDPHVFRARGVKCEFPRVGV